MKTMKIFLGVGLIMALAGCSSRFVKSDYDREVNFAKYKTFDWQAQAEKTNPLEQYTLSEKRIKKAVEKELTTMGYQKQTTGTPDFLIAYHVKVEDLSTSNGNGSRGYGYGGFGYGGYGYGGHGYSGFGYGGYGHGFGHHGFSHHGYGYGGYGYPGYGYSGYGYPGYGYVDYGYEGTIILDIIDTESNELVWRGSYSATIDDSGISEKKIKKAVKHILAKFPPQ